MRLKAFCAGALLAFTFTSAQAAQVQAADNHTPSFKVDPSWPKQLPKNYVFGGFGGIAVDSHDHIWVLSRPKEISGQLETPPNPNVAAPAPSVVELDAEGNFIQGWGRPYLSEADQAKFEWPITEHGITVDQKDNVWICGYGKDAEHGKDDNQCLKFTKDGKFLLQIGHSGKSKGSLDTDNLNHATQVAIWPKTNEAFISDGYVNRRVIVFDADTGKFKRMWGAYGNKPDDAAPRTRTAEGPGPQQFNPVHGVKIANDGLVYVNDRQNNRIQVFTIDGKFVKEGFVARDTKPDGFGTAFSSAFSPDQKYIYVADTHNFRVHVLERETLKEVPNSSFGHPGPYPGQFVGLHIIATDSKGNLYTAEGTGARVQKWILQP